MINRPSKRYEANDSDSCLSQHDVTGPKAINCQRVQEVAKVLGTGQNRLLRFSLGGN